MAIEGMTAPVSGDLQFGGQDQDAQALRLAYRGTGGELFFIVIKNLFFTLVTLGIYTPWARTTKRAFLWRQIDIAGQRLEYTGTGRELFRGYLKVALAYLLLFGVPALLQSAAPLVAGAWRFGSLIALFILVPYAIYGSRRYLLSRTRWRGIRFGLAGDAKEFTKLFMKTTLLTVATLGFYGPVANNRLYGFIMKNTRYGTAEFGYDGPDGEAFKISIKGFFLTLLTLGIYLPWYVARMQRFRLSHTHFAGTTGRTDLTGGLLFKLFLVNLLGNALTLGLAFPWTTTYTLRTVLERMSFVGAVDFAQITQQAASGDAAADGLADALDVGLGV
jgi:uncharacterized membrane protein YjgN (DUF898 family)